MEEYFLISRTNNISRYYFRDLHVDSCHLCFDINDFMNILSRIGSNCENQDF